MQEGATKIVNHIKRLCENYYQFELALLFRYGRDYHGGDEEFYEFFS